MDRRFVGVLFFVAIISLGNALECYVCTEQPGNVAKCLNSIATCDQGKDEVCMTEVKWGSTPYWTRGAQKQFFVSKRCAAKADCARIKKTSMKNCTNLWYQDWQCFDCCVGDRCNYYVFSGSDRQATSVAVLFVAFLASLLFSRTVQ